jgi:hypothetical protein
MLDHPNVIPEEPASFRRSNQMNAKHAPRPSSEVRGKLIPSIAGNLTRAIRYRVSAEGVM